MGISPEPIEWDSSLMVATETIHQNLVIIIHGAQWESQTLLERFIEFSIADIGVGRLPTWWWDPSFIRVMG
jgi:hypothetical protein